MGALGVGVSIFLKSFFSAGDAGPGPLTVDWAVPVMSEITYRFKIIGSLFTDADRLAADTVRLSQNAGEDISAVAQNLKDITHHTYETVIPHSMSWLYGYIMAQQITPIHKRLDADESSIRFLMGWRGQIDNWRHNHVDPELSAWRAFKAFFDGWPTDVLNTWHEWFKRPHEFGVWAAPVVADPLVGYLATKQATTTRDVLSDMMVDAWVDRPNDVWESILRWSVTQT